ncbi:DUF4326 domain-containing protein [Streptomyces sp. DSM 44917]|uniref:DUF4326 domain-containing protein n=1 Tax=Streptomyces boetiae TaxID=3075541 RepID=A0ABU2L3L1_9ACTN|nr:DUF4326 domain-containing protein [Streptomyces sp. DSM 44917]MDT0306156.1 DUF4326 domain-containing protein [Streptomyces sp. DSM 44917]
MTAPRRVQRTRRAGQPGMPPGARYVGRGTRWGNPSRVVYRKDSGGWHVETDHGSGVGTWPDPAGARRFATEAYRAWIRQPEQADLRAAARAELAGRDLACWCPLPAPGVPDHCHAAVLLQISNSPAEVA